MFGLDFSESTQWLEFVNNNAAQVPAYGILRVTGINILSTGRIQLSCDQPSSYGDTGTCMINGIVPVDSGKYGMCTRSGIVVGYYDSASTPAFGQSWGPISGSWKFSSKGAGWVALGAPTNSGQNLALFAAKPLGFVRGQVGSDVTTGNSGTLTVYTGAFGSEMSTSQTISGVQNNSSCTVKSGKMCSARYVDDNGGWEFFQAFNS